jgi:hypothetical protein
MRDTQEAIGKTSWAANGKRGRVVEGRSIDGAISGGRFHGYSKP